MKTFILFSIFLVTFLVVYINMVYPNIIRKRIKKAESLYIPKSYEEIRVGFYGYLIYTTYFILLAGSAIIVFIFGFDKVQQEQSLGMVIMFYSSVGLLIAGSICSFVNIILLPKKYFRYDNDTIYYHTGFRVRVITSIHSMWNTNTTDTWSGYFVFRINDEDKKGVYFNVNALIFKDPVKVHDILKSKVDKFGLYWFEGKSNVKK